MKMHRNALYQIFVAKHQANEPIPNKQTSKARRKSETPGMGSPKEQGASFLGAGGLRHRRTVSLEAVSGSAFVLAPFAQPQAGASPKRSGTGLPPPPQGLLARLEKLAQRPNMRPLSEQEKEGQIFGLYDAHRHDDSSSDDES